LPAPVSIVAAREVPRFARISRDWQQLIEMRRVVDTVMIDQDLLGAADRGDHPVEAAELAACRRRRRSPVPARTVGGIAARARAPAGRSRGDKRPSG
jgi:hypothetical protein